MIVVESCFFECSLKTCTFVYLIMYLIVSILRFINGIKKFNEFNIFISLTLELRHVVWSFFLVYGIYGIWVKEISHLAPCPWIQAIDLAETTVDYVGFIFTKRVIIPSFGNSNKRFDHKYKRILITFPCLVVPFFYLWVVVYSYYCKELENLSLPRSDHPPVVADEVIDDGIFNMKYSMLF